MCSVYDSASQTYGQPMFVVARGQAIRSFQDEVQRQAPDNVLNSHPEDFELFCLGQFDDVSGQLLPVGEADLLIRGKDCAITRTS